MKVIVSCIFVVVFSAILARASSANGTSTLIVNGNEAVRGQFPYQVSLRLVNGDHFCSGAIVSKEWIVTTAFCVYRLQPEVIVAIAGAQSRSQMDGVPYWIKRIHVHAHFEEQRLLNDIAMVRTQLPILFLSKYVRPIALPTRDYTEAGVGVVVGGWGFVKVNYDFLVFDFDLIH